MHTVVDTDTLTDAVVMLEAFRAELLKCGLKSHEQTTKGIELFSVGGAQEAIATLKGMAGLKGYTESMRRYTIAAISQGLEKLLEVAA